MGCTPVMALLPHALHLPPHSTRFLQFAELGLPVAPSDPKPSINLRGAGEVVSITKWRFPSAALESQLSDQQCGCCGCGRGRSSPCWEGNGRRGGDTTLV